MSQCLSFFTVLVIDGLRLSLHVFVLDWFALLQYLLLCPQSSDVKDVGYVIVSFPYRCSILLLTCHRIMTSRTTARIISIALVALG
jgi:hypothetical protein